MMWLLIQNYSPFILFSSGAWLEYNRFRSRGCGVQLLDAAMAFAIDWAMLMMAGGPQGNASAVLPSIRPPFVWQVTVIYHPSAMG